MKGYMQVAVDAVVFTVINDSLKILLIERKNPPFQGLFALPGGFVNPDENLEKAVKRELHEETGVRNIFLRQLGSYGNVNRDPRGRIISIAFLALINPEQNLKASTDARRAVWHPLKKLPELAFDHDKIIEDALAQLRMEIQTTNIAFQILPKRFTLSQLQTLYENVLNKKLDKRNFRKRINALGILIETKESFMEGAHRPAKLYSFSNTSYTSLRDKIHVFLK